MNVIGKIIAIIAFVFIILIIVNYRSILPYFDNLALGGGTLSPFQIGASYVEQANQMSPYSSQMTGAPSGAVTYGEFVAAQKAGTTAAPTKKVTKGRITVQKIGDFLSLTTENVSVSGATTKVHIWLTNQAAITATTKFIDFGSIKNGGTQTYQVNLGNPNLSLTEYKHVMIIDEESKAIYGQSILSK